MTVIIAFVLRSMIVALAGLGVAQLFAKKGPAYASLTYKTTLISLLAVAAISFVPIAPSSHALRIPASALTTSGHQARDSATPSTYKAKHFSAASAQSASPDEAGARAAIGIWVLGIALLLIRVSAAQVSLLSLKRRSKALKDPSAALVLSKLSKKDGMPSLLTHSSVKSPFLAGIFRPSIYIPEALVGDDKLEPVLAHEMVHFEHNDCAWKLLQRFTSAVLWFNPFVWILCKRFDEAIEEHCDQVVIEKGCDRPAYARVLLELAQRGQSPSAAAALSAGVVDFRSTVGKRVVLILDVSRKTAAVVSKGFRFAAIPAAAALAIGVSVMISGEAIAQMSPSEVKKEELVGINHAKQVALAAIMYTNDYDDQLPYVTDTDTLKTVVYPYMEKAVAGASGAVAYKEHWSTHNPNHSEFLFNMALGGVSEAAIPEPANTVLFYESNTWPDGIRIVAFSDGHVKKEDKAQWEVSKKYLTQKYARTGKRPLPHQRPDSLFHD